MFLGNCLGWGVLSALLVYFCRCCSGMCTVAVAGIITVGIEVLRLLPVVVFVVVQAQKVRSPKKYAALGESSLSEVWHSFYLGYG